ncbi:Methyltransferase_domain-containing protein [Hexamita inflata]|uniref:Methyltransferase domain-containing protein n=1 Tax=Hexamita inflata TaxID=28002 RepID=A0AA86TJ19_9EUKA|nr:Methyltransferase domain-containing protein [Hexamita inflata]CAI9930078.1 Methyltransferase domain-containing protein [Hexamita inflata]
MFIPKQQIQSNKLVFNALSQNELKCDLLVKEMFCQNDENAFQIFKNRVLNQNESDVQIFTEYLQKEVQNETKKGPSRTKQMVEFLNKLDFKATEMLDFCCGDGSTTLDEAKALNIEHTTTGIDQIEQKLPFKYIKADLNSVQELDVQPHSLITIKGAFHHVNNKENALRLMKNTFKRTD